MSFQQSSFSEFPDDPFTEWNGDGQISLSLQDPMELDILIEQGFDWEESIKLIHLREGLYENSEMRQRLAEDAHLQFARWLYERGEMSDF